MNCGARISAQPIGIFIMSFKTFSTAQTPANKNDPADAKAASPDGDKKQVQGAPPAGPQTEKQSKSEAPPKA